MNCIRPLAVAIMLIACALAPAQKPTVAVMVNGNKITDKSKQLTAAEYDQLAGEVEEFIDSKYAIFDRSAEVQNMIMKEHEYQRSGNVSDTLIKALNEQYSVQYLCIISVNWSKSSYHLQARLTDVVTKRVKTVNAYSMLNSSADITAASRTMANKLLDVADSKSIGGGEAAASAPAAEPPPVVAAVPEPAPAVETPPAAAAPAAPIVFTPEAAAPPQSIPANVESNPASSGSKGGVFYKPAVSISLGVLGLGAIAYGVAQDREVKDVVDNLDRTRVSYAEDAKKKRNAGYAVGAILLASGITFHIFF